LGKKDPQNGKVRVSQTNKKEEKDKKQQKNESF
jgi:hypothetical protein